MPEQKGQHEGDRSNAAHEDPRESQAPRHWPTFTRVARYIKRCLWLRITVFVVALLGLTLVALTNGPLAQAWLLPKIEDKLGVDLEAGWVRVSPRGSVVLSDVTVRSRFLDGPAGELLTASRVVIIPRYLGTPGIDLMRLDEPRLRVAISEDGSQLNLAALSARSSSGAVGLPRFIVRRGRVELGEFDQDNPDSYKQLKSLFVDGLLEPTDSAPALVDPESSSRLIVGGYTLQLRELDADGNPMSGDRDAVDLVGAVTDSGLTVTVRNFSLEQWPASRAPTIIRPILEELALAGRVPEARFVWTYPSTLVASLDLAGVGVTLPFTPPNDEAPGRPRMTDVRGTIGFTDDGFEADLSGNLEDLPYQVTLDYAGLTLDAPFTATIESRGYRLGERPELVPYAPDVVSERLGTFMHPTALVDASVKLQRTAERPDDIDVSGWLEFVEGKARYKWFPYPFEDMSGIVTFDERTLNVVEVHGRAHTGATLFATGTFAPPGPTAEVNLTVEVRDVPIDGTLKDAMGENRRGVIDAIFNEERYEQLRDSGRVLNSEQAGLLRSELAELRAQAARAGDAAIAPGDGGVSERIAEIRRALRAPVVDLGGIAEVDVKLHREPGEVSIWTRDIQVRIPEGWAVPEAFPMPVRAEDVLVRIDGETAVVTGKGISSVAGGSGSLEASVDLRATGVEALPTIQIEAREVPIHGLLIRAVPRPAGFPLSAGLFALRPTGLLSGIVTLEPRVAAGRLGYRIDLDVTDGQLAPVLEDEDRIAESASRDTTVEGLEGSILVTESRVAVSLDGELTDPLIGEVVGTDIGGPAAPISVSVDSTFGDSASTRVSVNAADVEARTRVEALAGAFAPTAPTMIRELRRERAPSGTGDVSVGVLVEGGETGVRIDVSDLRDVEFEWLGGRAMMTAPSGRVSVEVGELPIARFRGLAGTMGMDGEPGASVWLDGTAAIPAEAVWTRADAEPLELRILAERVQVASPLVRRLAEQNPDLLDLLDRHSPEGFVEADLQVRPLAASEPKEIAAQAPLGGAEPVTEGVISPTRIGFDLFDGRVELVDAGGYARFAPGLVEFDGFGGYSIDGLWDARVSGLATTGDDGSFRADAALSVHALGLPRSLRSVLPPRVAESADAIEFAVDGALDAETIQIAGYRDPSGPALSWVEATGTVQMRDAAAVIGVPLTEMTAEVGFSTLVPGWPALEPDGPLPTPSYSATVNASSARALGVLVGPATLDVRTGEAPPGQARQLLVDSIDALVYGGRMAGAARLVPDQDDPEAEPGFETDLRASGVAFAPLWRDIARANATDEIAEDAVPLVAPGYRGLIDGELSLRGTVGDRDTWRGRGAMRISGGDVVSMPFVLGLIEVSNLLLPSGNAVEELTARYYIDGPVMTLEDLSIFSGAVRVLGFGTITWPDLDLDFRFSSEAMNRIPLLSSLVEGLRDEVVTATVSGTANEVRVSGSAFSTTRAILASLFGVDMPFEDQLDQVEQRLELQRGRRDRTGRPLRAAPVEPMPEPRRSSVDPPAQGVAVADEPRD
ncbi:MAG: hypothetical protein AAGG07_10660 [Planctomycetota bacterium]